MILQNVEGVKMMKDDSKCQNDTSLAITQQVFLMNNKISVISGLQ